MNFSNLKLNTPIKVIINDKNYKSNIQDIKNEEIIISLPSSFGNYLHLEKGEKILLEIPISKISLYKINTTVNSITKENSIPLVKLNKPTYVEKIQRRKNVRVLYLEEINYIRRKSNLSKSTCFLIDFSAGGIKIKAKESMDLGENILFGIELEDKFELLKGEIVRKEHSRDGRYFYGVEFKEIEEETEEKIINKVFKLLRKELQKKIN